MRDYMISGAFVLLIFGLAAVVVIFNGLISLRNEIRRSWSNIDVLLKQRFDEIPRLVEVCKGYMRHENEVLRSVIQARAQTVQAKGMSAQTVAEDQLTIAVHSLFSVVENYPQLHANQSFIKLQSRITELENQIADRREFYNQCVTAYNTRCESFPDLLIAALFRFKRALWWRVAGARESARPL